MSLFTRLGYKTEHRDARLRLTSAIIGRTVSSWSDLTAAEGIRVITELQEMLDAGDALDATEAVTLYEAARRREQDADDQQSAQAEQLDLEDEL